LKHFLIIGLIFSSLNSLALTITGIAKINGSVLYSEVHQAQYAANGTYQTLKTDYFDKNQKLVGKMTSTYSANHYSPNYLYEDLRTGKIEKVGINNEQKNFLIEKTEKGITYKSKLELKNDSIAGLGFHNFLVTNYDKLTKEGGEVYFVNTEKVDQYKFDISILKRESGKTWFKLVPNNIVYRAFLPPMILCYDDQSKRVQNFEGLSNIKDEDGKLQKVTIEYSYK
jgi:hypothetical protein